MRTLSDHFGDAPVMRLGGERPIAPADRDAAKQRQQAQRIAEMRADLAADHFFAELERTATGGMTRGLARLEIIEVEDVPEDMRAAITFREPVKFDPPSEDDGA